jgi:hypothetical protein
MPRILNRYDMRNDDNDPPDPQPVDYIRMIKAWLEDERTKAPFPLEVDYMGDQFLCLRVYIPLPPVYQGPWSTGSPAGEQREADRQPPGQEAGNAAGSEEPERWIPPPLLRICSLPARIRGAVTVCRGARRPASPAPTARPCAPLRGTIQSAPAEPTRRPGRGPEQQAGGLVHVAERALGDGGAAGGLGLGQGASLPRKGEAFTLNRASLPRPP